MHFLCDLVCLWGRLHSRLKTSKEALLKDCEQLILCGTNVNAIFPFIRAIIQELSEDGVQFCIELCAHALRSCPPCDVVTKSLIYKTMASLVPNDLEICRACALLVFFLERSVEAYKMVYILYMHPDQEYHVECCPIGNRVRFDTLQTLKKDLYFDPEFWNLIALRTNCLKLINEKVLSAALEEIMEENWIPSHYLKETKSLSSGSKFTLKNGLNREKTLKGDRQSPKDTADKAPAKKIGRPRLNKHLPLKKGNQGSKQWRDVSSDPTRRSTFWQLDRLHCNNALDGENRRTTRLSERIPAKRKIRAPKWLLEDSGTLEKNSPVRTRRQNPSFPYLPLRRRRTVVRSNTKDNVNYEEKLKENQIKETKQDKKLGLDSQTASLAPQLILELSLPDNELLDTFTDEPSNRHRGLPQRLFYKPTLKMSSETKLENTCLQNEAILKAQDLTSFVLMLHCYSKRPKGQKIGTNPQGLTSTVTCPSNQEDVSNKENKEKLCDKPTVEKKEPNSQTHQVTDEILSPKERLDEKDVVKSTTDTVNEPIVTQEDSIASANAESTVEMEANKGTEDNREEQHSIGLENGVAQNTEHISHTTSEENNNQATHSPPPISALDESKPQEAVVTTMDVFANGTPSQEEDDSPSTENVQELLDKPTVEETIAEPELTDTQTSADNVNNILSVTVETKGESEKPQSEDEQNDSSTFNGEPVVSEIEKDYSKSSATSPASNTALEDDGFDPMEPQPECEESKLEFCCIFCHKVVKGHHLVVHSMFHYRKDECMFCGVAFKNNLKAMMHLSDHLEELKKLHNPSTDNSPTQLRAKTKQKTTVKAKTVQHTLKRREREKKSVPTVRKLRSGYKFRDRTKEEDCSAKNVERKDFVHKVNGHIGKRKKKKGTDRIENNLITPTRLRNRSIDDYRNNETKPVRKEESVVISSEQKQETVSSQTSKQTDTNRNIGPEGKLCCPVDGCTWFSVKKHAAFLYHVLENHYSNAKPLELAFHVANNSCSICKRVLYSFEHFQHHVVRHRLEPRHPCPHKGCTARFKTTIEMRRHARKHSPLQAVCCLPGCPKLFICQWALILHEKDHFSKRSKAAPNDDNSLTLAIIKQEKKGETIKKKVKQENTMETQEKEGDTILKEKQGITVKKQDKQGDTIEKQVKQGDTILKEKQGITVKKQDKQGDTIDKQVKQGGTVKKQEKQRYTILKKEKHRDTIKRQEKQGDIILKEKQGDSIKKQEKQGVTVTRQEKQGDVILWKEKQEDSIKKQEKQGDTIKKQEKQGDTVLKEKQKYTIIKKQKQNETIIKKYIKSKEEVASTPSGRSPKESEKTHTALKKGPHAPSGTTRFLRRLQKRQNKQSLQIPHKIVSSVGKLNYKLRHSLQRKENKARPSLGSKVLTPRQAKSTQNSTSVITSGKEPNQAKTSEVHTKLKVCKKSTDWSKLGSTEKVDCKLQRVRSVTDTTKKMVKNVQSSSKDNSKTSGIKSISVRRTLRNVAPVANKPVLEEKANLNTPDATQGSKRGRKKKLSKTNTLKDMESAQASRNSNVKSKKNKVAEVMEVVSHTEETRKDIVATAEECDKMEAKDSSKIVPVSLPKFANQTVTHEKGAEEDSSSKASSKASIFMTIEQNVALPQNAESECVTFDHVFESTVTTVVQNPETKAVDSVEKSVETKAGSTSAEVINDGAFEKTLQVENKVCLAAEEISILDKFESADLSTNANTSLLEEKPKEPENFTSDESVLTDKTNSLTASPEPSATPKPFRPKFCNKSDILSALKTLVKSKNDKDKSPNEDKNSPVKRKSDCIKTSVSKKLKFETETQEDAEASVDAVSEKRKAIETTDSSTTNDSASVSIISNENKTSKDKVKKVRNIRNKSQLKIQNKKPKTIKTKPEKKQRTASKVAVDKSTKKKKKEKSEAKGAKPKSKDRKTKTKASTKPDAPITEVTIAGSTEVESQSVPSNDNLQASNMQCHNGKDDEINETQETEPEMPTNPPPQNTKKLRSDFSRKKRNVFDLVPEDEESPLTAFEKALTEYKKRPYMRLPATAYLEEKFTVMPKRRKDMSMFFGATRNVQASPEQRQRCANCFSTFSSDEQLQWHLQQKCSNLFGFDSDEEGTS